MKLKNINFFEQHVEKFAFGLAVIFMSLIAYVYMMGSPNAVDLGTHKAVDPDKIDERVVMPAAQRLSASVKSDALPFDPIYIPNYMTGFNAIDRSYPIRTAWSMPYSQVPIIIDKEAEDIKFDRIYEPKIPVPQLAAIRTDKGTIDSAEVDATPALATLIGKQAPYDVGWVTLAATFDMAMMRSELTREDGGAKPIPPQWWQPTFGIADVEVERQVQNPDGSWGEAEPVSSMLGEDRPNFREEVKIVDPSNALVMINSIIGNQYSIIQPNFYSLVHGTWLPATFEEPEEAAVDLSDDPNESKKRSLQKRIKLLEKQIQLMQTKMKQTQEQERRKAEAKSRRSASASSTSGGPQFESSNPSRMTSTRPRITPLQRLQNELKKIMDRRTKAIADYNALAAPDEQQPAGTNPAAQPQFGQPGGGFGGPGGVDPYGAGGFEGGFAPGGEEFYPQGLESEMLEAGGFGGQFGPGGQFPSGGQFQPFDPNMNRVGGIPTGPQFNAQAARAQRGMKPLVMHDEVEIWANDIQVEPGKTYRYRLRLSIVNPLYQQLQLPEDQVAKYSKHLTLKSEWSAWSEPISTERSYYFYLVEGQQVNNQAAVEVWKFFGGAWRSHTFRVRPGDPIGGVVNLPVGEGGAAAPIPFDTGAFVVDLHFGHKISKSLTSYPQQTTRMLLMRSGEFDSRMMNIDKEDAHRRKMIRVLEDLGLAGL